MLDTPGAWAIAIFGALLIGVSKTGLGGCGILAVALFAQILPSRASTGYVLPMLICADIVAVTVFRRHAVWKHVIRMFPPTAAGVILGALALRTPFLHSNTQVKVLIGGIITVLVIFTYVRRYQQKQAETSQVGQPGVSAIASHTGHQSWLTVIGTGLLAGFLTMVANAAGPVTTLYLLAARLPMMEFIGTGAWLFFLLNTFKVPFSAGLHLITGPSLLLDMELAPFVVAGAFWGKWLVSFLNQRVFEELALLFALLSGINMLFSPILGHHGS
jgi:hypothetical protein